MINGAVCMWLSSSLILVIERNRNRSLGCDKKIQIKVLKYSEAKVQNMSAITPGLGILAY